MKLKINIPSSLHEITLGQYQEFLKYKELDEASLQLKMVEIFCNVSDVVVRNMKATDIVEITSIINTLFDTKHQLINRFTLNNDTYGFIPSLDDMTFGEYVDLDTFISDDENLHRVANVLFRKVKMSRGERYVIEDYDSELSERAKDFPVDAVLGAIVFFYNLGKELSIVMMSSLDKKNEQTLAEYLISQPNGVGTTASMHSLTEILRSLNISLN